MYLPILILIIIVAIVLILVVMVQNPKGGGLSSSFGGGGGMNIGGVQNTNSFLDKATWTLAIAMFALILLSNFAIERNKGNNTPDLTNTLDGIEATKPATSTEPAANETKDSVK